MWYDALQVARYVITRCFEAGKPVSNLKLQKMLYFLWVDFYKKKAKKLFLDDICAWQLGPVIPDVYYEYCSYAGRPIFARYESEINACDEKILDELIEKYVNISATELVAKTHELGTAWDEIYRNGLGNREVIPFSLIIAKEVG